MATQIPVDPTLVSANTLKLENTHNRDVLIAIEKKYQQEWQKNKVFESDAPSTSEIPFSSVPAAEIREKHPKYFGTFAYPYMNGSLHAGHSFTVSKVEFTAGFARLTGKRVLFPLGFHCTGMPIKACADKLVEDVRRFGKTFENYHEEEEHETPESNGVPVAPTQGINVKDDITKFKSKKGKQAAKTVKANYQFQTMLAMGIPKEEIHKFADANYWLEYFPPLCEQDLIDFGARIDWRRKFVTTDANPYYDAFVRWQMNRLHEMNKILYGKRYTIYSPKDGQPCMDHDRTKGEGVGPTEYTALKLKVKEWSPEAAKEVESKIPKDASVYFVPATLRPETMYGQTCCFVGPKIKYGIFKVSEKEYYVVTKRAAWNMAFQGTFFDEAHFPRDQSELQPVVELPGSAFVGTLVKAPLSVHTEGVRILPMETVSATKGTGVVTSVPSDSPDDFATVRDLAKKADFYGIKKEWAELEIIPIIDTPAYGNLAAKYLVDAKKIQSPKDATLLAEAKDMAYKEGFYNGTMLVGEFKGEKVSEAKDKVRNSLIKSGDAFPFADPSAEVISRSADECVVAYVPQWFLNYGENDKEWQQTVLEYVKNGLETYTHETQNQFVANLEWLNQWACARTYGLGSKLPWDPKFLVESLSDSTIYMSYYTIAHFLHGDKFGKTPGLLNIKDEQMTDDVWDYIFTRTNDVQNVSKSSKISVDDLQTLRRSFEYWYPLDMRSSGKDLIPNHLTFFLYIHLAIFPREYWPRSVRSNGHLLLNGDKMSKSTGNFLTLSQAVKKFGADATRIALADAGDGMEDANFEEKGANAAIMRMYTLKEWIEDVLKDPSLRQTQGEVIWDKLFEDEMNLLVHEAYQHYSDTNYKLALKSALYDFQSARDFYREACLSSGTPMSRPLVQRYVELQSLLIATIAPHWAEYMWLEVLHKDDSIQNARWPEVPTANPGLTAMREYVKGTSSNITSAEAQAAKKMAKGKSAAFDPRKPKRITIFVAKSFPAWQDKYVDLVREMLEKSTLDDDRALNGQVAKMGKGPEMKKAMPFVQALKKRLVVNNESPETVFERKLPFDEVEILNDMKKGLMRTTGCKDVVVTVVGEDKTGLPVMAEHAVPGLPSFLFENVE
ncbi:leucine-tRNA ligase [Exophiala xenobiotica]|uniref:leucine--tRNA ligase n=1 Tax=Exophiala xenobiotica TaxID=348802 RepID=A0A0D2C2E3_9EURO|nr:leucine-tRNA ligase [Exophiala xenobiotica]KIW58966.1 leucine-tRNA ligase [Exophiala xenobiotica]